MAIVLSHRNLTVDLVDTGGNKTTRSFRLTAADDATMGTDVTAILAALDAVTDANVTAYSFGEVWVEQSLALPAAAEVENQLQLTLPIFQKPNKSGTVTIPAPTVGIMVGTSGQGFNQPDFADAALIAYINLFTTGGKATLSDGEVAVLANAKGKRIHVKSFRG